MLVSSKRFVEPILELNLTTINRTIVTNVALTAAAALIALGIVTFVAVSIEKTYLETHSFFFDPASYYRLNIRVFREFNELGLWQAFLHELSNNDRCPARTIPLLLFMPSGLADLWGHLWTELPVIFSFLFLLSWTVFSRTSSYYLALASIATFCSFKFLYDPKLSIAAYWLDTTAACSLGSAVICLLNYTRSAAKPWLFGFGLFASLAALSRWSSAFYLLSFAAVALPIMLWVTRRTLRTSIRSTAFSFISTLPGIFFVLNFSERNFNFYKTYGYALDASIFESISWNLAKVPEILGVPTVVFLSFLSMGNSFRAMHGKVERTFCVIALWYPISIFVFLSFVAKAVGGVHPLTYFGPALLVAGFCTLTRTSRHWIEAAVITGALTSLILTGGYVREQKLTVVQVLSHEKLEKERDVALSSLIMKTGARSFAAFDRESAGAILETFFTNRVTCEERGATFSVHESYLKGWFGKGTTPEEMAELSFKRSQTADLVVVFSNPSDAFRPGIFNNRYSRTVSRLVSERIPKDPDFRFVSKVNGPFGELSVYRNSRLVDRKR